MHMIFYHYADYQEETGRTLLEVTDENTEAVHSRFRVFEETHGYKCNRKGTLGHKTRQHKSIVHFNRLNIGDK